MARQGLYFLCAGLMVGAVSLAPAAPGAGGPGGSLQHQLAVQAALDQGRARLQVGDYEAAVSILEKQLSLIDGNHRYLTALHDAYCGYVAKLQAAGRYNEASVYLKRLAILEPPSPRVERVAPAAPAPAPAVTPAPAPEPRPASAAGPRPRVAVGKAEDDPFSAANGAAPGPGKELVERAERAFAGRQFEAAHRLFEEAHRLSPEAVRDCRERWAYCKLHAVAQVLNRPGADVPAADLEREVRSGLKLAPKLAPFGNELLAKLRERGEEGEAGPVEVKHTPRQGGGWAVAATANFRIFHATSRETAGRAARVAEATRAAMTRKWFGEAPGAWSPRCDIYLHATAQDYARATGAPAQSPGHSTISLDAGRVIARRVDLRCDDPNLFTGVLPHETTHVVLAGRFGKHNVPRWADEGVAVLTEPRDRIELHLNNLPLHRREGTLFGIGQLMRMGEYPEPRFVGPFYAQSVALVEFLAKRKGAATFTRFLRDGLDGGYEPALRKHYGINGFAELQRLWDGHAFGGGVASAAEQRR